MLKMQKYSGYSGVLQSEELNATVTAGVSAAGSAHTTGATTSQIVTASPETRDSRPAAGHQSNSHKYVDMSEILVNSFAKKFVPTLQEMDNTQSGRASKGAQETVAWFYGMRSFNGHPSFMWPTPRMVLDQFGTAHGWASKVLVEGTERNLTSMLINRFSTLHSIAEFMVETCPQQYRTSNGRTDYTNALAYARDMDECRGISSYNSWWDRVRVNRSSCQLASELVLVLPALKQLVSPLSDCEVRKIEIYANEALTAAKSGRDGLGESHTLNGRQKFAAAERLQEINKILVLAGSSLHKLTSQKRGRTVAQHQTPSG